MILTGGYVTTTLTPIRKYLGELKTGDLVDIMVVDVNGEIHSQEVRFARHPIVLQDPVRLVYFFYEKNNSLEAAWWVVPLGKAINKQVTVLANAETAEYHEGVTQNPNRLVNAADTLVKYVQERVENDRR
jgi:hypothetical protein